MKKRDRQTKKWLKRFIYPVVSELPTTVFSQHLHDEDGNDVEDDAHMAYLEGVQLPKLVKVIGRNHSIVNGEVVREGARSLHHRRKLFVNIRETGKKATEIVANYKAPHFRNVSVHGDSIRLRIITE